MGMDMGMGMGMNMNMGMGGMNNNMGMGMAMQPMMVPVMTPMVPMQPIYQPPPPPPPPVYYPPPQPAYYPPPPQPQQQQTIIITGNNDNGHGSPCQVCGKDTGSIPRKKVGCVAIVWCVVLSSCMLCCIPLLSNSCKDTELICEKCQTVKSKIAANIC